MVRCLRCMGLCCLHYAAMVSWSLAVFMVPGEHYCQGAITNCAGVSDMGSTVVRKNIEFRCNNHAIISCLASWRSWEPLARPRLPITLSILRRVMATLVTQEATWEQQMVSAALNLCFFGFLRSGEMCCPSASQYNQGSHLSPLRPHSR